MNKEEIRKKGETRIVDRDKITSAVFLIHGAELNNEKLIEKFLTIQEAEFKYYENTHKYKYILSSYMKVSGGKLNEHLQWIADQLNGNVFTIKEIINKGIYASVTYEGESAANIESKRSEIIDPNTSKFLSDSNLSLYINYV